MKNEEYKCRNGAYHTGECCDTCWNKHPEAKPNEMFMGSPRCNDIEKQDWIKQAQSLGFTFMQAIFLYTNCR